MSSDANRKKFACASVHDVMTSKKELLGLKKIAAVKGDAPLSKAFHKMKKHRVHSVPVFSSTENKKFIGFLDVFDLTVFALQFTNKFKGGKTSWLDFLVSEREWADATCEKYLNSRSAEKSTCSNFISPEASLSTAAAFLSDKKTHRLAVINSNHELIGIISQTDVVRYIDHHLDRNDVLFIKPLKDLQIGTPQVVSVDMNSPVSDAFVLIQKNNITAVAAVDENGSLVGCISSSDIKEEKDFDVDSLVDLCGHTIAFFLSNNHRKNLVTVTLDDDVESVLHKLKHQQVHRVFVVDKDNKPIRVISLTDVLGLFVPRVNEEPTATPPTPDSTCTVVLQHAFGIEPEEK